MDLVERISETISPRDWPTALKPLVFVGQKGFTQSLVDAMDDALDYHELVKVKFVEFKEKEKKLAHGRVR